MRWLFLLLALAVLGVSAPKPKGKTVSIKKEDTVCVDKTCFTGEELIKLDRGLKDLRLKSIGR